jgi:hypothetical protein
MTHSVIEMMNSTMARHDITDVLVHDFNGNNQSGINDYKKEAEIATPFSGKSQHHRHSNTLLVTGQNKSNLLKE